MILRGCNLGNWLLLEMWMLEIFDIRDQHEFESILVNRFGEAAKDRLMEIYRANYIRPRDFSIVQSFGFNVVRLPFEYRVLEDDTHPFKLRPDAFHWLDRAVEMAEAAGIYVILDMHGAPGRQSVDHTTGRAGQNHLWDDEDCQARTVWLWKEIAEHFRNATAVAGYDLINEPFGDYQTETHQPALISLIARLYDAVHDADPNHVIFIPGTFAGISFYGSPADHGWANVAFTEHDYPAVFRGKRTLETIARYVHRKLPERAAYLKEIQSPFLVGEFNIVLQELAAPIMLRRYYDEYAARGWAATMWSYKLLRRAGGADGSFWGLVANADPLPDVDIHTASLQGITDYFTWFGTMEYAMPARLQHQLTAANPDTLVLAPCDFLAAPPAVDAVPGWEAVDVNGSRPGGQKRLADNGLAVYGGGSDIWSTSDQFRFLYKPVAGDLLLRARIDSLDETNPYAKAGLMLRNALAPDAAHVLFHVFPNGRLTLGWRRGDGLAMKERVVGIVGLPVYLELARRGVAVHCRYSQNGRDWYPVDPPVSVSLGERLLAGLAVLGHDENRSLTTAVFRDIRLQSEP